MGAYSYPHTINIQIEWKTLTLYYNTEDDSYWIKNVYRLFQGNVSSF